MQNVLLLIFSPLLCCYYNYNSLPNKKTSTWVIISSLQSRPIWSFFSWGGRLKRSIMMTWGARPQGVWTILIRLSKGWTCQTALCKIILTLHFCVIRSPQPAGGSTHRTTTCSSFKSMETQVKLAGLQAAHNKLTRNTRLSSTPEECTSQTVTWFTGSRISMGEAQHSMLNSYWWRTNTNANLWFCSLPHPCPSCNSHCISFIEHLGLCIFNQTLVAFYWYNQNN